MKRLEFRDIHRAYRAGDKAQLTTAGSCARKEDLFYFLIRQCPR